MNAVPIRRPVAARAGIALTAAAAIAVTGLAACSDSRNASGGAALAVTSSDTACTLDRAELTAGSNTMRISNAGSKTTEVYVYTADGEIVTERENIGPGLTVNVSFEVAAGQYEIACKPGQTGDGIRQKIRVTGQGGDAVTTDQRLVDAVATYRAYVTQQAQASLPEVRRFVTSVRSGDLATAADSYAPSRQGWERVEPVAESFGDLDPKLDLREADLEPGQEWTGWHRLEKAVFSTKSLAGQGAYADRLLADYTSFIAMIPTAQITPTSMANGAKELLDEVATGKITGEEDIWSGTDLWDFAANVDGARRVYQLLRAMLGDNDTSLRDRLDSAFADMDTALEAHAPTGRYVDYRTVTQPQRHDLATAVDALAEPLSHLAASIAQS